MRPHLHLCVPSYLHWSVPNRLSVWSQINSCNVCYGEIYDTSWWYLRRRNAVSKPHNTFWEIRSVFVRVWRLVCDTGGLCVLTVFLGFWQKILVRLQFRQQHKLPLYKLCVIIRYTWHVSLQHTFRTLCIWACILFCIFCNASVCVCACAQV